MVNRRLVFTLAAASLTGCWDSYQDTLRRPPLATDAGTQDAAMRLEACTFEDPPPAKPLPEGDCDPLVEAQCALPWPSNLYLRADARRRTGYTLTFGAASLPANPSGVHVDPTPFKQLDGYGVGTPIMVQFPNLDVSMMATEDHVERSVEMNSRSLLFEVNGNTLTRVPHWVELDRQEPDAARKTLFLRPGVILKEGARYIVAFRDLRTTGGQAVAASAAFTRLRAGMTNGDSALGPRQARFNEVFTLLEGAGVARDSLTLAWDFNTASSDALHGRLLAMRDDALERVGPMGPALTVDDVRVFARQADPANPMMPVDENIAIELGGSFEVPHYMHTRMFGPVRVPVMNYGPNGRPIACGTRQARFLVRIPHSALNGPPHGLVMYGHGLLGSGEEVRAGYNGVIANTQRLIFFATNLSGMSEEDLPVVLRALVEMSAFQGVGDRLQQGMVQWVLLARAMRERLGTLPEVTSRNIQVNREELFYSGISQGGIFGGTFMAITPDITRGHLGVPGNNYSTLLHRSTDFASYFGLIRGAYTSTQDQAVLLSLTQLNWDATDPVSYYRHITASPFPGNQPHHVLLAPAKGDHQVAVVTNEVAARTTELQMPLLANYDHQRTPWGITPVAYPRTGSGIVLYDHGNPWPAIGNAPPDESSPDPHGLPRRQTWHQQQMVTFFRTGMITDVCGGDGCHPD